MDELQKKSLEDYLHHRMGHLSDVRVHSIVEAVDAWLNPNLNIVDSDAFRKGFIETISEVEQALGKVLLFPWYKDDQKNFPGTTEADGVCVGDADVVSLAMMAADKIKELRGLSSYV